MQHFHIGDDLCAGDDDPSHERPRGLAVADALLSMAKAALALGSSPKGIVDAVEAAAESLASVERAMVVEKMAMDSFRFVPGLVHMPAQQCIDVGAPSSTGCSETEEPSSTDLGEQIAGESPAWEKGGQTISEASELISACETAESSVDPGEQLAVEAPAYEKVGQTISEASGFISACEDEEPFVADTGVQTAGDGPACVKGGQTISEKSGFNSACGTEENLVTDPGAQLAAAFGFISACEVMEPPVADLGEQAAVGLPACEKAVVFPACEKGGETNSEGSDSISACGTEESLVVEHGAQLAVEVPACEQGGLPVSKGSDFISACGTEEPSEFPAGEKRAKRSRRARRNKRSTLEQTAGENPVCEKGGQTIGESRIFISACETAEPSDAAHGDQTSGYSDPSQCSTVPGACCALPVAGRKQQAIQGCSEDEVCDEAWRLARNILRLEANSADEKIWLLKHSDHGAEAFASELACALGERRNTFARVAPASFVGIIDGFTQALRESVDPLSDLDALMSELKCLSSRPN